jgi:Fic/DOC family
VPSVIWARVPVTGDHLLAWCLTREDVLWHQVRHGPGWPGGPVRGRRDGLAHWIGSAERARGPLRAQRLHSAYAQVRKDARDGGPLSFPLLAAWQRAVLGAPSAPFRSGPAFAKGGRERYSLAPGTQGRFGTCLAESADAGLPVAARAARAYLDVCFFHPFSDGNARSALITLVYVLATERVVLDEVGPVAHIQRFANDAPGALALADLVAVLIEGTLRRSTAGPHN